MRKLILSIIVVIVNFYGVLAISPFFELAKTNSTIPEVENELVLSLKAAGYNVLSSYKVANSEHMKVIIFSSTAITKLATSIEDRGALAVAHKIGLVRKSGQTIISVTNPDYMFHAYFGEEYSNKTVEIKDITSKLKMFFSDLGYNYIPFGGDVRPSELKEYQYMMGMPEFTDPVKLNNFNSFAEGVNIIKRNLNANKAKCIKVYEWINEEKKIAVFGIGLMDEEKGEQHFLSIIGEEHVAAMPYEIILENNKATMLHGRYRFALYWPELTMSTFTKIMSTPGYVEETLEFLTE